MGELSGARVLVAGGGGFLGGWVVDALRARCVEVAAPTRADADLLSLAAAEGVLRASFGGRGPTVVINCAGYSGGLGANRKHPARFFYDNLAIGMNVIEGVRRAGLVERCGVVQLGNMVMYPGDAEQPYHESSLFGGRPDAEVASYAGAKLALLQMLEAYRREHGLRGVYVIPTNLYGPRDTLDPERSHAVGALCRRFVEAERSGAGEVVCWGTGGAVRDFLYVEDAASGVMAAARVAGMARADEVEVYNLGSGGGVTIRELAERVAAAAGYCGRIVWDAAKGDGAPMRVLSSERAQRVLGWRPTYTLEEGLGRTVAWVRGQLGG